MDELISDYIHNLINHIDDQRLLLNIEPVHYIYIKQVYNIDPNRRAFIIQVNPWLLLTTNLLNILSTLFEPLSSKYDAILEDISFQLFETSVLEIYLKINIIDLRFLPEETWQNVLLNSSYDDIISFCQAYPSLRKICSSDVFWYNKIVHKYQAKPKYIPGKMRNLFLSYGHVLTFGNNSFCQLGSFRKGPKRKRVKDTYGKEIIGLEISASIYRSFIIDAQYILWAFGNNRNKELGIGPTITDKICIPRKVSQIKFKKIISSGSYSLLIDIDDQLYGFGKNSVGQLGLTNPIFVPRPTMILNENGQPYKVKFISAYLGHSLIIDMNNHLFLFGRYTRGGRMTQVFHENGQPFEAKMTSLSTNHVLIIDVYDFVWSSLLSSLVYYPPTLLKDINDNPVRALSIISGLNHYFIIDLEYKVYARGSNSYGQLGLGDFENKHFLTLVTHDDGSPFKAKKIATSSHTLLIDINDELWGCGKNDSDQLGLKRMGIEGNQNKFIKIIKRSTGQPYKASSVACGFDHSMFIKLKTNI